MFISIFCLFFISSCGVDTGKAADKIGKKQFTEEKNLVDVIVLKKSTFTKELLSNGKLKALQKSRLKFETTEQLIKLNVKNGSHIAKGGIIAQANTQKALQKVNQAKLQVKKAELSREELLIGQGFSPDKLNEVPDDILDIANTRSGWHSAQNELKLAQNELEKQTLKAPFTGIIANLNQKLYENINPSEPFCTLIDDRKFEVEFSILEKELKEINIGQKVKIKTFADNKLYQGYINEINPLVEDNGMVKVKALINNSGKLIEGMNVEVIIENKIPEQLVVPKPAVVLRQNKEVLFRYKSGTAYWTYVITGYENSHSYTVTANKERGADIQAGDTVIISGNLNLAHESKVEIRN
ncbi:MAG: efflux RND transporter periplasmic adaptor subunit [Bacteroidales bacterium]|nr:efflux RND transporter periplasmic adaptor subunit [Bacteroidales bacterium]